MARDWSAYTRFDDVEFEAFMRHGVEAHRVEAMKATRDDFDAMVASRVNELTSGTRVTSVTRAVLDDVGGVGTVVYSKDAAVALVAEELGLDERTVWAGYRAEKEGV